MSSFPLEMTLDGLTFRDPEIGDLVLDFNDLWKKKKILRGKKELIARAVGPARTVVDLTLGLAEDALFLTKLGYHVRGIEKEPWLVELLKDAHGRWTHPDKDQLLKIDQGEALEWLKKANQVWDVIYLDPMFEETKSKSLPRKEMQIFRKWVTPGQEIITLLNEAVNYSPRVVLKRPLKAAPLSLKPQISFLGKTIRFDVYLSPELKSKTGALR